MDGLRESLSEIDPTDAQSFGYPSSSASGLSSIDYNNRAAAIDNNYTYLLHNIQDEGTIRIKLVPFLSEEIRYEVLRMPLGGDLKRRIINVVKQNVSSAVYDTFIQHLYETQPELYEKLTLGSSRLNVARASVIPSTDASCNSSDNLRAKAEVIKKHYHILVTNLEAWKMFDALSTYLHTDIREELKRSTTNRELAIRIIGLVQSFICPGIYDKFMNSLSQFQPGLYNNLTEDTAQQTQGASKRNRPTSHDEDFMVSEEPAPQVWHRDPGAAEMDIQALSLDSTKKPKNPFLGGDENGKNKCKRKRNFAETITKPILSSMGFLKRHTHSASASAAPKELEEEDENDEAQMETAQENLISMDDVRVAAKEGNLNSVNLLRRSIEDEDVKDLCPALAKQGDVTSFHFIGDKLKDASISDILQCLSHINTLLELSMKRVRCLDRYLPKLNTILEDNNLSQLSLDSCTLTTQSWTNFSKVLPNMKNLTDLSLDDTSMGDSGSAEITTGLKSNTNMSRLSVANNGISDYVVYYWNLCIRKMVNLKFLSFAGNQISDTGAKVFEISKLEQRRSCKVNLSGNQIGKEGACHILNQWTPKGGKHSFDFSKNQITELKVPGKNVDLKGNTSGKDRVDVLIRRFSRGESFRVINLNKTKLRDSDLELISRVVCTEGKLVKLEVKDNHLTDACLPYLTEMFHRCINLESVVITGNKFTDDRITNVFGDLKSFRDENNEPPFFLKKVFWETAQGVSDNYVQVQNEKLCRYDIQILLGILAGEHIQHISIEYCYLRDDVLKVLFSHIAKYLDAIETIEISHNTIDEGEVTKLADEYKRALKTQGHCKIVARSNEISLGEMKRLIDVLSANKNLTFLDLSSNDIGPDLGKYLASSMNACPLISLNLDNNSLREKGSKCITEALNSRGVFLKHLCLARNKIPSPGFSIFWKALGKKPSLEYLDLSGNPFTDASKHFNGFSDALQSNRTLKTLVLTDLGFTDRDMPGFVSSLSKNNSLSTIDISRNNIGTIGFSKLITLLANGRIKYLDVGDLQCEDVSYPNFLHPLCQAISLQSGLSFLGLRNTGMNISSAEAIAKALGQSDQKKASQTRAASILDLSGNNINVQARRRLVQVRKQYGSPRCVFDNQDGEENFIESPFIKR